MVVYNAICHIVVWDMIGDIDGEGSQGRKWFKKLQMI
jgi:hypothetical protein